MHCDGRCEKIMGLVTNGESGWLASGGAHLEFDRLRKEENQHIRRVTHCVAVDRWTAGELPIDDSSMSATEKWLLSQGCICRAIGLAIGRKTPATGSAMRQCSARLQGRTTTWAANIPSRITRCTTLLQQTLNVLR